MPGRFAPDAPPSEAVTLSGARPSTHRPPSKRRGRRQRLLGLAGDFALPRYVLFGSIPFGLLLLAWAAVTETKTVSPIFLPRLSTIAGALWRAFAAENMLVDVGHSAFRITTGFLVAAAMAVPVGLWAGASKGAEAFFEPLMDFVRYLPVPAFIPVCILWFGLGDLEKVVIIFLGTFFSLVLMVATEVSRVPRQYVEAAYTLGAAQREVFTGVLLRGALPGIVDSLRITIGWAWTYLVVAELVGATSGIGYAIIKAQRYMLIDTLFAAMVIIGVLGVLTDFFFRGIYRMLFPWSEKR